MPRLPIPFIYLFFQATTIQRVIGDVLPSCCFSQVDKDHPTCVYMGKDVRPKDRALIKRFFILALEAPQMKLSCLESVGSHRQLPQVAAGHRNEVLWDYGEIL